MREVLPDDKNDGMYLYYLEADGTVRVFDVKSHTELYTRQCYDTAASQDTCLCKHKLFYVKEGKILCSLNMDTGEESEILSERVYLPSSDARDYIPTYSFSNAYIIAKATGEIVVSVPLEEEIAGERVTYEEILAYADEYLEKAN